MTDALATPPPTDPGAPSRDRKRLSSTRDSVTKKLTIGYIDSEAQEAAAEGTMLPVSELDVYVTVGFYDDGTPGEIFLRAGKMGATVSGLLDALGICMSIGLQSGVPLERFTGKLRGCQFEPAGFCTDPKIRKAMSLVDMVAHWLEMRFGIAKPEGTP